MNSVYLCIESKGSLYIPKYRCLLICRVQYMYTIEHTVGYIAYHRFQLCSSLISGLKSTTEKLNSNI